MFRFKLAELIESGKLSPQRKGLATALIMGVKPPVVVNASIEESLWKKRHNVK